MPPRPKGASDRSLVVRVLPPLLVVVTALAAAWPVLGNYFYADDFANLVELANYGPRDFLTAPAAGHMYIVRNAVFFLSFRLLGMEPTGYFVIALATHVANVLLLYAVVRRLTGSTPLALLGAMLFGGSPVSAGTLGWYSVYGHALGTTFALGAALFVVPRPGDPPGLSTRAAVAAACCMLAASQCFGTATGVAVIFPLVAVLLRPAAFRSAGTAAALVAVPVLVLAAWFVMHAYRTRLNPWGTVSLKGLLILASDWRDVIWMTVHIFALGVVSLVLGGAYSLSRYPDVISIGSLVAFAVAVAASLRAGWARARALIAFLASALACYAAVAAGRAGLYAALAPKTLLQVYAAATRYHYLAQAWLSVVVCLVLAEADRRLPLPARFKLLLVCGWGAWAAASGVLLRPSVDHFAADRARVTAAWDRIVQQIRHAPTGSTVCLPVEPAPVALGFPGSLGIFMLFNRTDEVERRRVRFVSSDPKLLARRDAGGRMQQLLLPDDECPQRDGHVSDGLPVRAVRRRGYVRLPEPCARGTLERAFGPAQDTRLRPGPQHWDSSRRRGTCNPGMSWRSCSPLPGTGAPTSFDIRL
jgi:hypothetical protein